MGGARVAPKVALAFVYVVLGWFSLIAFLRVLTAEVGFTVWDVVLAGGGLLVLLAIQTFWARRQATGDLPRRLAYVLLVVQALLAYLPFIRFGASWTGMPGFLAGSVLLVLPPYVGWTVFATVAASTVGLQVMFTGSLYDELYVAGSTIVTGLVVYGLTRLAALVAEVHAARLEMAKMAVAQERLRFARDLHDLLGYSLSAITLKTEVTQRLMVKYPARARAELNEILGISRQALADVRAVAKGYRELSFEQECRSAQSVLNATDVDVRITLEHQDLPVRVATVLATVLREGVTNLLRHSKASWCEIVVRQSDTEVTIDLANDGVAHASVTDDIGGSGILNLSSRVVDLGGALAAGPEAPDRYRLHVRIPLREKQNDEKLSGLRAIS